MEHLFNEEVMSLDTYIMVKLKEKTAQLSESLIKKNRAPISLSMGAPTANPPAMLIEKLKEFVFDQDLGYIACALLDSKVRAVSEKNMIISFEYASNVKQYLFILDKIVETYFKITKSYKNIAIITDDEWNRYKNEYIDNVKKGIKYEVVEEPKEILEENENNDIISNKAIELFGDIVEIE